MKKFSIAMNSHVFDNYVVTEELITYAIDYVRDQAKKGNYDFLTLINEEDNSFIQVAIGKAYDVEIRYPNIGEGKGVYVTKALSYEEAIKVFNDFYRRIFIDTQGYKDISYYLN